MAGRTVATPGRTPEWTTWRAATEEALYGAAGFYRRAAGPAAHFRTSVHASPVFAEAVLTILRSTGLSTLVDVGSGRGELLRTLHAQDPALRLVGVDVAGRPVDLPGAVLWQRDLPDATDGLLLGNEWLDDVPVDVAVLDEHGWRLVLVDPATGDERPGDPVAGADLEWLKVWWPRGRPGHRAEIGRPRDEAWAAAVRSLRRGLALAVDYNHDRGARPPNGSLAGYRDGARTEPVPDGSCDVTSHVALDACAAAGTAAGAAWTVLTDQRTALRALVGGPEAPPHDQARRDPAGYLAGLARGSQLAELARADGLGGFGWLVQGVDVPVPAAFRRLATGGPPTSASAAGSA